MNHPSFDLHSKLTQIQPLSIALSSHEAKAAAIFQVRSHHSLHNLNAESRSGSPRITVAQRPLAWPDRAVRTTTISVYVGSPQGMC